MEFSSGNELKATQRFQELLKFNRATHGISEPELTQAVNSILDSVPASSGKGIELFRVAAAAANAIGNEVSPTSCFHSRPNSLVGQNLKFRTNVKLAQRLLDAKSLDQLESVRTDGRCLLP